VTGEKKAYLSGWSRAAGGTDLRHGWSRALSM